MAHTSPPLFSWRGAVIGAVTGMALLFVGLLVFDSTYILRTLTQSGDWSVVRGQLAIAAHLSLAAIIPGGVTGGITRHLFWRINTMRPRGLEILGIWFILMAFLAQAVDPLLTLLDAVAP